MITKAQDKALQNNIALKTVETQYKVYNQALESNDKKAHKLCNKILEWAFKKLKYDFVIEEISYKEAKKLELKDKLELVNEILVVYEEFVLTQIEERNEEN